MNILVGYTGFVGSNINKSFKFDKLFNSKNIEEAYGLNPDLCVYSGVKAEKYIANSFPEDDLNSIYGAIENIKKINPKRIVLISTVDVLEYPYGDEGATCYSNLPYGKNRRVLEKFVEENFDDYLIVRLPGLYGINLKKNFIYDYKNPVPKLLSSTKFKELSENDKELCLYYHENDKGFYEINDVSLLQTQKLINMFKTLGFSGVNFTDSRSIIQFYNLAFLWNHITVCLDNHIKLMHIAPEPVSISELYYALEGKHFVNEINPKYLTYSLKTKYSKLFGKNDDYLFSRQFVINDICKYVKGPNYSLSISNMAIPNETLKDTMSFMIDQGYKGIELLPTKVSSLDYKSYFNSASNILSAVDDKLKVCSIQSILYGCGLNLFNESEKQQLVDLVKKIIIFAEQIKCPNIVFGCPKNRIMDDDSKEEDAISFFREIGDFAYDHKTTIALEPNPVIYGTNFINTTSEAIAFCKSVNSKGLKINLDLGTVIYNNEDLESIFKEVNLINHIHVSEPYLKPISFSTVHYELFKCVIEHNYNRYISIEMKEDKEQFEAIAQELSDLSSRI